MSRRLTFTGAVAVLGCAFGWAETTDARDPDRRLVASDPVTMVARPAILGRGQKLRVSGSVDSRAADEIVTIEAKDCRQQRAQILLKRTPAAGMLEVWVLAKQQFWHRHVLFQRLNRRLGTWSTVETVVLTETGANDPTGRTGTIWSRATFRAAVARGSLVRAVFPLSQARPCYLAGYSQDVRT